MAGTSPAMTVRTRLEHMPPVRARLSLTFSKRQLSKYVSDLLRTLHVTTQVAAEWIVDIHLFDLRVRDCVVRQEVTPNLLGKRDNVVEGINIKIRDRPGLMIADIQIVPTHG